MGRGGGSSSSCCCRPSSRHRHCARYSSWPGHVAPLPVLLGACPTPQVNVVLCAAHCCPAVLCQNSKLSASTLGPVGASAAQGNVLLLLMAVLLVLLVLHALLVLAQVLLLLLLWVAMLLRMWRAMMHHARRV